MAANKDVRQTIVRLLSSMASAKEISQYLKRFSQLDAKRFAVVKVGGAVLRDDLDALTSSLAFLQQVGLTPIVADGSSWHHNAIEFTSSSTFRLRSAIFSGVSFSCDSRYW